jgi:hypothetical protein
MAKRPATNPGKKLKQYNDLIAGLAAKAPAGVTELGVEGTSYPMPGLVAKLTGYRDLYAAVAKAENALKQAVEARDAAEPQASKFLRSTMVAVKAANGKTNVANKDYGITPDREPTPLTGDKLVARTEKAAATRKARGTLGKRQKQKIKGPVATPAPVTVPPSPTSATPPATTPGKSPGQ